MFTFIFKHINIQCESIRDNNSSGIVLLIPLYALPQCVCKNIWLWLIVLSVTISYKLKFLIVEQWVCSNVSQTVYLFLWLQFKNNVAPCRSKNQQNMTRNVCR